MKKVTIDTRPQGANHRLSPDQWVSDRRAAEPLKRLTLDVSLTLHKRIKSQCAIRGVKMADVLRDLLEQEFPEADPLWLASVQLVVLFPRDQNRTLAAPRDGLRALGHRAREDLGQLVLGLGELPHDRLILSRLARQRVASPRLGIKAGREGSYRIRPNGSGGHLGLACG